jgi:hypothetical protein
MREVTRVLTLRSSKSADLLDIRFCGLEVRLSWVWYERFDLPFHPPECDYASSPVDPVEALSNKPLDIERGPAIFRIKTKLSTFERFHCPPSGASTPLVDDVWKSIILSFVPASVVQFYPVTIFAKDGTSTKFSWVRPFPLVRCIDVERSDIDSKVEKPGITFVIGCRFYVHHDGCLGQHHIARDEQMTTHLLLSDALRHALVATGESEMFYRPGDLPTVGRRQLH